MAASPFDGLEVDKALRPVAKSFSFDLARCLSSVITLEAMVSEDASTADALGAHRIGNGVVIGEEGLVLTIGYLVIEADEVTLTTGDGRRIAGHVLGVDAATGFGLVHALEPLNLPAMPLGDSRDLSPDDDLISAGAGGRSHALAAWLLTRAPFAGYWEYLLDEALFVEPAHPHWSGAALIGPGGDLVGVGSLRMDQRTNNGEVRPLNMFVPAELLGPIIADLARGRIASPPRPWFGLLAQDDNNRVVVLGVSADGPAANAGLREGDVIRAVAGDKVTDLADLYRKLWALGPPGVTAPLTLQRGDERLEVAVESIDRTSRLKKRRLN